MTNIPDQKFWDDFDSRMYKFYKTYRDARNNKTVAEAKAVTEQEFGENADWCEVQYQDDVARRN